MNWVKLNIGHNLLLIIHQYQIQEAIWTILQGIQTSLNKLRRTNIIMELGSHLEGGLINLL